MFSRLVFFFFVALLCAISATSAAGADIPFEFHDGLIWVKVATADRRLNFVLDSGAGASVLDLQTARQLGVEMVSAQRVQAVGAETNAYRVRGFSAQVGDIFVGTKNLLAMDLRSVSAVCSEPIHGLLGQNFFRGRIVEIDFAARWIRVLQSVESSARASVLPLKFLNGAMCVPVSVEGCAPRWTRLDTGCDDALHWVSATSGTAGAFGTSIGLAHSSTSSLRTTVQLGRERIENVKTTLHARPIFAGEAGLLGNGVLAGYRVTVDALAKRVLLEKR